MKINPNVLRKKVIDMVRDKQSGHIGGAFSMAELTSVLYEDFDIGGKDKLILSKGPYRLGSNNCFHSCTRVLQWMLRNRENQ